MRWYGILVGLALTIPAASATEMQTSNGFGPNPGFWPSGYLGPQDNNTSARGLSTAAQMRLARKQIALKSLRRDALALQQQDGGKLSDAHREMLQARLDRINTR